MKETDWDALLEEAAELIAQSESALGVGRATTVEWLGTDTDVIPHRAFRVDEKRKRIALNRDLVSEWLRNLPHEQAEDRFAGLVLRATAALHFSPPSLPWQEAVDRHVRSMEEEGLDASYGQAFVAASEILEGHRLDRLISDRVPGALVRLAELVRFELEVLPTFDTYPRAAIIMSRPYLPEKFVQTLSKEVHPAWR